MKVWSKLFALILGVALIVTPAFSLSFYFPHKSVVTCDPNNSIWTCSVELDGHWYLASRFPLFNHGSPATVTVLPYGAAEVVNHGQFFSFGASPFAIHHIGVVPATARTVARSSKMTVIFPEVTEDLPTIGTTKEELRAAPVHTGSGYETWIFAISDEPTPAYFSVKLLSSDGTQLSQQWLTVPAGGIGWEKVIGNTGLEPGQIRIVDGWGTIASPQPPTSGRTYVFVITGRETDQFRTAIVPSPIIKPPVLISPLP